MSPEEQLITIAEACGFTVISDTLCHPHPIIKKGVETSDVELNPIAPLPDYLNDLNAMHEAEKILTPDQEEEYVERLSAAIMTEAYDDATADRWKKSNLASSDSTYRATAAQRARAFLKTTRKWKD